MVLPLFVLAMTAVCVSCSDDDDADNSGAVFKKNIVGEWYADNSSSNKIMRAVNTYYADGTYSYEILISSQEEAVINKQVGTAKYSINGDLLQEYGEFGGKYKIVEQNEYKMDLLNEQLGVIETLYKIIDTKSVKKGDVWSYDFSSISARPVSFTTSDSRIATVDTNGEITAVRCGTAYITANMSYGAVVLRVNVVDENDVLGDYSDHINLSKKEIINRFGNKYFEPEKGLSLAYYMGDWDVKDICFYLNSFGKVESIIVEYWPDVDIEAINMSFNRKYTFLTSDDGNDFYAGTNGKTKFLVAYDKKNFTVLYKKEVSDFEYLDSFKNLKADEIAAEMGFELTDDYDGGFSRKFNGDLFENVTVLYDKDTKEVKTIGIRCVAGVKPEDVEPWYKENYPGYVENLGYCEREDWWNMEHPLFIQILEKNGFTWIMYAKL